MTKIQVSIIKVIELIEEKIKTEEDPEKLILLKGKYETAYEKLGENMDILPDIRGTSRMYLESYSDYINNPILEEMQKIEQLVTDMENCMPFRCKECGCEVKIPKYPLGNVVVICPKCHKYIGSVSDYGHGPIVPCDVFVGEKNIGQIREAPADGSYRFLSSELNVAFSLKNGYKDLGCYKEVAEFVENYLHEKENIVPSEREDKATFDDKILSYKMSDSDEKLSEIALTIIEAYNGSYKPHIFPAMDFHNDDVAYYDIIHTDEGYSLMFTKAEHYNPSRKRVVATDTNISDFLEHVFLVLGGSTSVKWAQVYTSDAVKQALNRHFDMEVELSNVGPEHKFDVMGMTELPITPTIWAKRKVEDTAFKEMEEKGFCYFDRDLWVIEL